MGRWDKASKKRGSYEENHAGESNAPIRATYESDPEGLREHVNEKVEALERLYETDVIGNNADLEDIAAKYSKLIPPDEVEKYKEMVVFLLNEIDLQKVADCREL